MEPAGRRRRRPRNARMRSPAHRADASGSDATADARTDAASSCGGSSRTRSSSCGPGSAGHSSCSASSADDLTFICGKSCAGKFLVKRKSRRDRMRAKLMEVREQLRQRMHQPIPEQGRWLKQVVTGFFNDHAVPTNFPALAAFRYHVIDLWRRSLQRRGQKDRTTWSWITKLAEDFLPRPRILHPCPEKRFAVRHPRWEPYAGMPHVRFCAGGAQQ